jgi:hypothetical protein
MSANRGPVPPEPLVALAEKRAEAKTLHVGDPVVVAYGVDEPWGGIVVAECHDEYDTLYVSPESGKPRRVCRDQCRKPTNAEMGRP